MKRQIVQRLFGHGEGSGTAEVLQKKLYKHVLLLFFFLHKVWFQGFIEAKRDTYWRHCYCDTSLLWGPQISTFSVYSTTKSQLLRVFDNYKFTLYPAHSHLCPCTPSLFILSSSPYSAHGHKSPFCCFSGLARHSLSPLLSPPPLGSQQVPVLG